MALDGSPAGEAGPAPALALARSRGAAVSLMRVVPGGTAAAGPGACPVLALQEAGRGLQRMGAHLDAAGLPQRRLRHAVRRGRALETALDQTRREGAGWLFLPRSGLRELATGRRGQRGVRCLDPARRAGRDRVSGDLRPH